MLVEPLARKQAPAVAIDAKFSIPYCVAVAVTRGAVDLDSFTPEMLSDPHILGTAARVVARVAETPTWQHGGGGALEIGLRDGRTLAAEVNNALGCPERPLSEQALVAKFVGCGGRARVSLSSERAERLAQTILNFETCADAGAVFAL
jgi:2-methylcitrate dehydratase PrpD